MGKRRRDRFFYGEEPEPLRRPLPEGRASAEARCAWLAARRWQAIVERELNRFGLTFSEWLVLEAAEELINERCDAVSQEAVAGRTELNKMTVSHVMKTLESKGLVDRGPDLTGRAYRVFLTALGGEALGSCNSRLDAAGAWLGAGQLRKPCAA